MVFHDVRPASRVPYLPIFSAAQTTVPMISTTRERVTTVANTGRIVRTVFATLVPFERSELEFLAA